MRKPQKDAPLQTDRYALTMLEAALKDGTAAKRSVFELFTRSLPAGRTFGMVAGLGRLLEQVQTYTYDDDTLTYLGSFLSGSTLDFLADFNFKGSIQAYPEGELFFANSPILTVEGSFAEGIILETLALSILNHDSAVASAAAHMRARVRNQKLYELGGRRTHEAAAVAAARAAYIGGFDATSNLLAGKIYPDIPTFGSAAHAFTLVHEDELTAFRSQLQALGNHTALLVDTYDIEQGIRNAVEAAGEDLFSIRIDSGDPAEVLPMARQLLDDLGAYQANILFSGDLNYERIGEILDADLPVDAFGVGTDIVLGSGFPTCGFVYKLVAVENAAGDAWRPVAKKSSGKQTVGGKKTAYRAYGADWHATREILLTDDKTRIDPDWKRLQVPYIMRGRLLQLPKEAEVQAYARENLSTIPREAIPTSVLPEVADNTVEDIH